MLKHQQWSGLTLEERERRADAYAATVISELAGKSLIDPAHHLAWGLSMAAAMEEPNVVVSHWWCGAVYEPTLNGGRQ